ncbi:hypothetical protein SAMN05428944_3889 [Streptomyces sp. 1222.5]|nr:hypothetical protein BX260_4205 [Streptomyces sp. 5112.2]SEC48249.1 hypothetical protein SAMN05428944_3889 [Streptomyces sp. 1222.5]SED40768.1 hypothetical protein SAMN05216532_4459 [Streptomyces sp. 2231.1]
MAAEEMLKVIMSWASENSHRGRLVRAFQSDMGSDPVLQAKRLAMLGLHAERQAKRKAGLVPA